MKAEKRKLQKFEKQQQKLKELKAAADDPNHESTDDDEIEAKIMSLFEMLEKGVQSETYAPEKKRKILAKVTPKLSKNCKFIFFFFRPKFRFLNKKFENSKNFEISSENQNFGQIFSLKIGILAKT